MDVGTIDAYYEANMDLVAVTPQFNLYDREWPIRTYQRQYPPAKFVFAQVDHRMGIALDSVVSAGCIISGGRVVNSVLSRASASTVSARLKVHPVPACRNRPSLRVAMPSSIAASDSRADRGGFRPGGGQERFHLSEEGIVSYPRNTSRRAIPQGTTTDPLPESLILSAAPAETEKPRKTPG